MINFKNLKNNTILVTGGAGFIGSNLCERLLEIGSKVKCLDNFSTGHRKNISSFLDHNNFKFIEGDIRDIEVCQYACQNVDYVLHQAALGSVPRSINDPILTNEVNINGFLNMLVASKDNRIKRFVYAASSSTYGDSEEMPKVENNIGKPLSPYAITKYVNELYAGVYARAYGFKTIGLRYFNVFGKRQDPNGAYAAVIPKWASAMLHGKEVFINGDGETSRDFCFIENAVQANILAATAQNSAKNETYNVAVGDRTTLNELFKSLQSSLAVNGKNYIRQPTYQDFRDGDVRHSQADVTKISNKLGYSPQYRFVEGIAKAIPWYINDLSKF